MRIRIAVSSIAVLFSLGRLAAELPPLWEDSAHAFTAAAEGLAAGADRSKVLEQLTTALAKSKDGENSYYLPRAQALAKELKDSAKTHPKQAGPREVKAAPLAHLRDTKFEPFLLGRFDEPGGVLFPDTVFVGPDKQFKDALAAQPDDPVTRLVAKDRAIISELIPLLNDLTPTRAYRESNFSKARLRIPRVCDYALLLIEYHSLCTFHDNASTGELLHELSDIERPYSTTREKIAKRVAEWWKVNQSKSIAAGLRDQIAFSNDAYGKFAMVRRLLQHEDPADKAFALETLRAYVRRYPGNHTSAIAGEMLAQHGDFTVIDEIYKTWHPFRDKPGHYLYEAKLIWYLCKYGKRREWDLLYDISASEFEMKNWPGGRSRLWGSVMHSAGHAKNPFAIPFLVHGFNEPWLADSHRAVYYLQELTAKDFGYKVDDKPEGRAEAIKRAQKWWNDEGKAKYTFDYIEKNMVKKETPKKP